MRIREVTNSPAQEWQARQELGTTEPLPAAIAAAILDKYSRLQVKRRQFTLTHDGKTYRYSHDNSATILNHNDDGTYFYLRYNPLELQEDPDRSVIHVHDLSGNYIETLPRKGKTQWFDAAGAQREIGKQRAIQAHIRKRIEIVRQPNIQAEAQRQQHNTQELKKLQDIAFTTLPVPETTTARTPHSAKTPASSEEQHQEPRETAPPVPTSAQRCNTLATTPPEREPTVTNTTPAEEFENFADIVADLRARDRQDQKNRLHYRSKALAAFDDDDD